MGQPTWRQVKVVTVPEREGVIWTPALDYLTPGKLYRIRVEPSAATANAVAPEATVVAATLKVAAETEEKGTGNPSPEKPVEGGKQVVPAVYREAVTDAKGQTGIPSEETDKQKVVSTVEAAAAGRSAKDVQAQRLKDQCWKPESSEDCTADGDPALKRHDALFLPNGVVGALIGKIGGSAGDTDFDKDKVVLFTIGRHCVFVAPDAPKVGSLYLGMNDTPASAAKVQSELKATIWEAL